MKKLFTLFATLVALTGWGANPAFTDMNTNQFDVSGNKVAVRDHAFITNEVAFGTLTVQDHVNGTNTSVTNALLGKFVTGSGNIPSGSFGIVGGVNNHGGPTGITVGSGNLVSAANALAAGRSNSIGSDAVNSISAGFFNTGSGQNSYINGETNTGGGRNGFLHGSRILVNSGIAGVDHNFLTGQRYSLQDGTSNTFVWSVGSPVLALDGSDSGAFYINASNKIVLLGAPIYGNGSGLTNIPGASITTPFVGVSGVSPYVVSNLWSVVLPDGATAFQLGNPGAGYASIFATNLIITPDGLHYTLFTDGTNSFFGGDLYLTNSTFHGKSFRPTKVAMTIVGATAQSTNLMEIQGGTSNILAYVDKDGVFSGNGSGLTNLPSSGGPQVWTNSVGVVSLADNTNKIDFSTFPPGANARALIFNGTNASGGYEVLRFTAQDNNNSSYTPGYVFNQTSGTNADPSYTMQVANKVHPIASTSPFDYIDNQDEQAAGFYESLNDAALAVQGKTVGLVAYTHGDSSLEYVGSMAFVRPANAGSTNVASFATADNQYTQTGSVVAPFVGVVGPIANFAGAQSAGMLLDVTTNGSVPLIVGRSNGATVFTLTSSGSVGLGVTNPAAKLDVAGAIHSGVTNTTTPALVSLGTNNAVLRCPDGGSWILRVGNDGTLSTVTNSAGL